MLVIYLEVEEEHAGGTIAFPSFDHGEDFALNENLAGKEHKFEKDF